MTRTAPSTSHVVELIVALVLAGAAKIGAQEADTVERVGLAPRLTAANPPPDTTKTFFTRRDLAYTGAGLAGTALVSVFDKRIAHWAQRPSVIGGPSRQRVVRDLTDWSGETTLTWAAVLSYGIGRLAHSSTTADVSLHMVEAQILTSVFGQTIRGVLGRARPRLSFDDQYNFHWGKGFTSFDYRSFPSLHSGAGFVAAATLTEELRERKPSALWYAAPVLYGLALVPGVTRMYNNTHWASDVAAGAVLGTLFGTKVVHYAHTHRRTKLDRALLGVAVVPTSQGGALLMVTVER